MKTESIETRLLLLEALTMALCRTHPDAAALTREFDAGLARIRAYLEGEGAAGETLAQLERQGQRLRLQIEPD